MIVLTFPKQVDRAFLKPCNQAAGHIVRLILSNLISNWGQGHYPTGCHYTESLLIEQAFFVFMLLKSVGYSLSLILEITFQPSLVLTHVSVNLAALGICFPSSVFQSICIVMLTTAVLPNTATS